MLWSGRWCGIGNSVVDFIPDFFVGLVGNDCFPEGLDALEVEAIRVERYEEQP